MATDLVELADGRDVIALSRAQLDVTDPRAVAEALESRRPDVVINTAAYHKVDVCESDPMTTFVVNAAAPQLLASTCDRHGTLLVNYSTDYVFEGSAGRPYTEDDIVAPVNVYGASKAGGEMAVRAATGRHLIIRTSGLYGVAGRQTGRGNFVETMIRVGHGGRPVTVVNDQTLTPTFTADLAAATWHLIDGGVTGTVHVTSGGECTWFDFAAEIFRLARCDAPLGPTTQDARPLPARRPAYSVLAHDGLRRVGVPEPRHWQDALAAYMHEREAA